MIVQFGFKVLSNERFFLELQNLGIFHENQEKIQRKFGQKKSLKTKDI